MTRLAATIFILLASLRCCAAAHAQVDDAIVGARICVSEAGFDADECRALMGVVAERAALRGTSPRAMMHAYAPRATGRRSYGSRSWIAALHPDRLPQRPRPEHMRVRFAALTVAAWEGLRGIGGAPRGALHWGARWCLPCRRRMRSAGLVPMGWGFSNAFFGRGR